MALVSTPERRHSRNDDASDLNDAVHSLRTADGALGNVNATNFGSRHPASEATAEKLRARRDIGNDYTNTSVKDHGRAHYGNHYGNVYNGTTATDAKAAEEKEVKKLMENLAFDGMDFRRSAIDGAYAETCRWIFGEEHFLRWLDPSQRGRHHNLLWIKGKPGSGKSTLMKCIL